MISKGSPTPSLTVFRYFSCRLILCEKVKKKKKNEKVPSCHESIELHSIKKKSELLKISVIENI